MTKMTIRLTTDKSKEYVDGIVRCMIGDYIHGHLTGLSVSVSGGEGSYHIKRGKTKCRRRRIPKELEIPEFMKKSCNGNVDMWKAENPQIPDFIKHPASCEDGVKGREFLARVIGGRSLRRTPDAGNTEAPETEEQTPDVGKEPGNPAIWVHENA